MIKWIRDERNMTRNNNLSKLSRMREIKERNKKILHRRHWIISCRAKARANARHGLMKRRKFRREPTLTIYSVERSLQTRLFFRSRLANSITRAISVSRDFTPRWAAFSSIIALIKRKKADALIAPETRQEQRKFANSELKFVTVTWIL